MDCIRSKFHKHFPCIINCKNHKMKKNSLFIYTSKCKQTECPRIYKLHHLFNETPNEEKKMYVYFKGADIHHTELLTNQLRGDARTHIKEKLKNEYASDLQNKMVSETDMLLKNYGNLNIFKSLDVLNTARSEALSELDKNKDEIKDLKNLQIEK